MAGKRSRKPKMDSRFFDKKGNILPDYQKVYDREKRLAESAIRELNEELDVELVDGSGGSSSGFGGMSVGIELDTGSWSHMFGVAAAHDEVIEGGSGRSYDQYIINDAADRMVNAIAVALLPLRRTGELMDSFSARINTGVVTIESTSKYALTILGEREWGIPRIDTIHQWILEAGISSSDHKNSRDLAGAMFTSWKTGAGANSENSVIRRLTPIGEKSYDYVTVAWDSIKEKIDEDMVYVIKGIVEINKQKGR